MKFGTPSNQNHDRIKVTISHINNYNNENIYKSLTFADSRTGCGTLRYSKKIGAMADGVRFELCDGTLYVDDKKTRMKDDGYNLKVEIEENGDVLVNKTLFTDDMFVDPPSSFWKSTRRWNSNRISSSNRSSSPAVVSNSSRNSSPPSYQSLPDPSRKLITYPGYNLSGNSDFARPPPAAGPVPHHRRIGQN